MSADEVHRLQTGVDEECKLAQKIFEQGHYAGRTRPTNTRQGTYATAPSGILLASINSNDPKAMADMLRRALDKWNSLSEQERMYASADPSKIQVRRAETRYPADGLVVRVFSRDLPRQQKTEDWRLNAWNQDYAWFTKREVGDLVPSTLRSGEKKQVPAALVKRLARFNFVDNVRGQVPAFQPDEVSVAEMTTEVTAVKSDTVSMKIYGQTKADSEGVWAVAGYRDMNNPSRQKRGIALKLQGTATYDRKGQRFAALEIVAVGTRYGATQYNGRSDDVEPAPIGYVVTLAGSHPAEKVAPSFFHQYGWD